MDASHTLQDDIDTMLKRIHTHMQTVTQHTAAHLTLLTDNMHMLGHRVDDAIKSMVCLIHACDEMDENFKAKLANEEVKLKI